MAVNVDPMKVSAITGTNVWKQVQGFKTGLTSDNTPLIAPPGIRDMNWYFSSAVKEDYSTNETVIYCGDISQLVVGVMNDISIRLNERYSDTLSTAFAIHFRLDVQALREDNFCIVQDILTV